MLWFSDIFWFSEEIIKLFSCFYKQQNESPFQHFIKIISHLEG